MSGVDTVTSAIGPEPASIDVPVNENPSILASPLFSFPDTAQSSGTLSVGTISTNVRLSGISAIEN